MSNLPEKDVYISQLKAAGFTDIQVCYKRYTKAHLLIALRIATFSQCHIVGSLETFSIVSTIFFSWTRAFFKERRKHFNSRKWTCEDSKQNQVDQTLQNAEKHAVCVKRGKPGILPEEKWSDISQSNRANQENWVLTFLIPFFRIPHIFNNYSPKWRWLVVDIYRAAKRQGKYPHQTRTPFFPSSSEVNSAGYSEFDEPISARV